MSSSEVLDLVFSQNGVLTQEQYIDIYDHSPTLSCVFLNDEGKYEYELVFEDKKESILCNVVC